MNSEGQDQKTTPRGFVPDPFPYHREVDVEIETLTNLGLGLGRVDGWVVMVPFALPGEKVRARIFRNRANFSEGDLLEILRPSPQRVEPRCPLFTECGGCQYQHFEYEGQLQWKTGQVRELLQRLAGLDDPPVHPAHGSPRTYGYRSKLTPHWDRPGKDGRVGPIGFLRFGQRKQLVDVPSCPIATERINEALPDAREDVRAGKTGRRKKARGGTLLLRQAEEGVVLESDKVITERVGRRVFQFRAGDFFQNNPYILPDLVEWVAGQAAVPGVRFLLDAYCGTGLFALCLSDRFERVAGVEISASSIQWAINNAAINRVKNAEFHSGSAEAIFASVDFPPGETAVILDPPRKGCDRSFLEQLFRFGPRRVVYVSCDPATQARDIREMTAAGYALLNVQPFDLFPQTRHIESVATLERSARLRFPAPKEA